MMDYSDELIYNPFYIILREKFTKKYDTALSKCWTICVPCSDSLREIIITEDFVDDHILKPGPKVLYHYVSTDPHNTRMYKVEDNCIRLVQQNNENVPPDIFKVKIMNVERGYNKEYQLYNIIITDKVLNEKYSSAKKSLDNKIKLNRTIISYREALNFLYEIVPGRYSLTKLQADAENICLNGVQSSEALISVLQEWIKRHWAHIIRLFNLDLQRDARFQKLLSTSLEIFVMHHLHDKIYSLLVSALDQDDLELKEKMDHLIQVRVTPDQLGVKEGLAISLPSAIVELATLDARRSPLEKLSCLKTTLDLIVAEIKGALADIETRTESLEENDMIGMRKTIRVVPTEDLIPLLIYVIVKSRPKRLITDLHYIQNFLWSVSPYDGLSYTIVTYKTAIGALQDINLKHLPLSSTKVKNELSIIDVLDIVARGEKQTTPLERQMNELGVMLEECTQSDAGINAIHQIK